MLLELALVLAPSQIAIEHVSIVQPERAKVVADQTVVIKGGKFTQIGETGKLRLIGATRRIDGRGKFLIPGLWDMHVHWYDQKRLPLFTANGVVGVRQMFGTTMHLDWRKKVENGTLVGPYMYCGSPIVDGRVPIWPTSVAFKTGDDAKALVSKLKGEGWDFIKTYSRLTQNSLEAIAGEANRQKIPFAGHVPIGIDPRHAARLGQQSMEHLAGMLENCGNHADEVCAKLREAMESDLHPAEAVGNAYKSFGPGFRNSFDEKRARIVTSQLGKTKLWQSPTLTVLRSMASLDDKAFIEDPRLKYMDAATKSMWDPANDFRLKSRKKEDWDAARVALTHYKELVRMLNDSGAKFLAGTDCLNPFCFPGFSLHDELALLVEAGLTPAQALSAATYNPAVFMRKEESFGTIAKNMRADAVVLDRNPLKDIRNTTAIRWVIQSGKAYSRAELDAMLKKVEDL